MWRRVSLVCLLLAFVASAVVSQEVPKGAWVDEVVFMEEPDNNKAIAMIEAGEADLRAYAITESELYKRIIESPVMDYAEAYGTYVELTFNPVMFFNDGRFNPFGDPQIREAMNWLIDRDYICDEIYGGTAIPRFFAITPTFPDYARLVDVAKALEVKYAHNPEKAKEVITRRMQELGAELVDGKWYYKGEPVKIIMLIRVEDERKEIGDYVATLLEDLGFTVERQYKTSREAAACWIRTDPAEGCFNIYTGGWVTTIINRDQGGNFDFFYTPRGLPLPLWQAYKPAPEFDEVAKKLGQGAFTTVEERNELMAKALELSMKDSVRVWVANESPVFAMRKGLKVASDLAGGVYGSWLWPYTIRWEDKVGGTVRVSIGQILNEPWNPPAGTNWIYDQMPIRGTGLTAVLPDPFTGLPRPQRVEKAEVYVQEGLPVTKTLDWVELHFVPEIQVPADAYIDWDAAAQKWITVGEKYPEGLTAKTKTVIYFDEQFLRDKWHDGSTMSIADALMPMILSFDRAKPESPIYDEATVPDFESFMEVFRGFRIVQEDPLVIEYYSDTIYLDAEYIVWDAASSFDAFYSQGPGAWHNIAIGILAEADKKCAFSSDKADKLGVEWVNYIAGPTLDILAEYLDKALAEGYIPYEPTLGKYITKEEAVARYQNLKAWYESKGHFWIGTGPFYHHSVDPVAGIIVLKKFPEFADPADKWLGFAEPKIAEVEALAPEVITIGEGVVMPIDITFKGAPYPADEIEFVKYLILDAEGNVILKGEAKYLSGPTWIATLTPDDTKALSEGTYRLLVAVSSKVVAIPSYDETTFIAVP